MSKTHNPYLRLFTRDIEGSPKVKSLSMEASGLYFRLLCRLTEPPVPGSIALHEWEQHHTWQRSLTQQCLATPDKQERLQYFAKLLSKYFQWRASDILKALRELYFFGIIVIEDDRLIQPRMYRDNGYKLADDPVDDAYIDRATGAYITPENDDMNDYKNHLKKTKKKNDDDSPARVHAHHALSNESEIIYNDDNNDRIEEKEEKEKTGEKNPENTDGGKKRGFKAAKTNGVGDKSTEGVKTPQKPRDEARGAENRKGADSDTDSQTDDDLSFDRFWDAYDKKVGRPVCESLWGELKKEERQAIMDYIPLYIRAQPTKRFRKNPDTFLQNRGWEDELIRENEVARAAQPKPPKEGDPVQATAPKKYNKW